MPPALVNSSVTLDPAVDSAQPMRLRGVRVHNLQNIDVTIPRGKLVVVTGVSGAGKSSLAFDTLYTEGQRRYIECFSASSRRFLERLERPEADQIDNIPPAVAVRATNLGTAPRAMLASETEIYDELCVLFARLGTIVCPSCGREVRREGPDSAAGFVQSLSPGTRYMIGYVPAIDAGAARADWRQTLKAEGCTRLLLNGQPLDLRTEPAAPPPALTSADELLVVIDRLIADDGGASRQADSLELAFERGHGRLWVLVREGVEPVADHSDFRRGARREIAGDAWRLHWFNAQWACGHCQREFTPIEPRLFSFNSPLGACPGCRGTGLAAADTGAPCPDCGGTRLRDDALAVKVAGHDIAAVCRMSASAACEFLRQLGAGGDTQAAHPVEAVVNRLVLRLADLDSLGLGHLALDRPLRTLSGGELRRAALAAALGAQLVNTLYVLDEPTAGLHPCDSGRLLDIVRRLCDAGNSVIVVEHDAEFIGNADFAIDLGPGAGRAGGRVVFQGPPALLAACAESVTAKHLSRAAGRGPGGMARRPPQAEWIELRGVRHNNLHDLTVRFPLGVLCAITGVSGSGKSSLIQETLYPALARSLGRPQPAGRVGLYAEIVGGDLIDDVVRLDQSPVVRAARSNPATVLKLFDEIRRLFAQTAESQVRQFTAGHFSFNADLGGRCSECRGTGSLAIDMHFLPDVTLACPACDGARFRREILEVAWRGLNIAEVLRLTVDEAFTFFRGHSKIQRRLKSLKDVGLNYLTLGQPCDTLSAGESQRLQLAVILAGSSRAKTLFLLDEPTIGLHPADVAVLLECFAALLSAGHSLIVIDHDRALIRAADYLIDLGPGAGPAGGRVVAQGPPETVGRTAESLTGRWL